SLDFNYNVIQHHKQNSQMCILHLVLRTNGGIPASGSGFACLAFGFLLLPSAGLEAKRSSRPHIQNHRRNTTAPGGYQIFGLTEPFMSS
ncbi:hypothetical protein XENORESO_005511, partial [Xenotaenia resolanae]